MNSQKPQAVFDAIAYARVMQDKYAPPRVYKASGEAVIDSPQAHPPKRHGSNKRKTEEIAGWVPPFIKSEIRAIAKKKGWSESKVVAGLVNQALQTSLGEQYGTALKITVEDAIKKEMQKYNNRLAYLAVQAYYSAEESRIINTKVLSYIFGSDTELFKQIVAEAKKEARANITRHVEDK
jgi:hypothetical protein